MWVWGEWEVGGKGECKDTAGLKTWAACRSAPVLSSDWTQGERKRDVLHIFVCTGMVTRGGVRARVRLRQGEKGGFYRGRTSLDKKNAFPHCHRRVIGAYIHARTNTHTRTVLLLNCRLTEIADTQRPGAMKPDSARRTDRGMSCRSLAHIHLWPREGF